MNAFDIIIAIPLLWGMWQGYNKGLILTLASLAALLIGVWGSIKFSNIVANLLSNSFGLVSEYNSIIAFSITFILIVVVVHLLARALDKILSAAALGILVKISGAALGALKWGLIVSILLSLYNVINVNYRYTSKETIEKSVLYTPVASIAPFVFSYFDFEWIKKHDNSQL
ncbi:MAG: CvpA family protein [Salinivirgaceae bacterium]|jgi:membrane protein required for colicin V production|nr:CvpA family protein [Bacteroidales bacterium]